MIRGMGVATTVDETSTTNIAAIRPEIACSTCAGRIVGVEDVAGRAGSVDISQLSSSWLSKVK
ncbi:hypothetical protein GCM10022202_08520 [Microbacterium marinilacus]|uniref:Uncharacterized protein n=1 Tax=Microbacterium marinilacus TaxID=415209 RepID=A0ABP7B858_9MICO